jgi:hypothetical protein
LLPQGQIVLPGTTWWLFRLTPERQKMSVANNFLTTLLLLQAVGHP